MAERIFTRLRRMKFRFQNMIAWCMILAMMGTNACILQDLFSSLNWHIIDAVVCAIAAGVIVDGLPAFLGLAISRGEGKRKWLLLFLAAVLSILMSLLVCCLRYVWFCEQMELGTISVQAVWEVYSQYFLMILPLVTSTTSFTIAALMPHIPADQPPEDPENEAEEEMNND